MGSLVAQTGQSVAIERLENDPRFARDVAERTGYVPKSILALPIGTEGQDTIGVLSILDRTAGIGGDDPFALASALAGLAVPWLATAEVTIRLAPLLLNALATAVADDVGLAAGLRREATRTAREPNGELAALAALLASARDAGPVAVDTATRLLSEFLTFARTRRSR